MLARLYKRIRYSSHQRFYFCSNAIEEWIDVPNFDNYQVSSFGNVYNKKSQKLLNINIERFKKLNRRVQVQLSAKGKIKGLFVSRLILLSFKPTTNHHNLHANHIDGDCYNNTLKNLNWMTPSENVKHAAKQGKYNKGIPIEITSKQDNQTLKFETIKECRRYLNSIGIEISLPSMSKLCQTNNAYKGIVFKYQNDAMYITEVKDVMNEKWKLYDKGKINLSYFVSNYGRVKTMNINSKKEKLLNTHLNQSYYAIKSGTPPKLHKIHRLVAIAFVLNPNNYNIVDHIDGNNHNNHASNLRWVKNHSENMLNPNTLKKRARAQEAKIRKLHFPILQLDPYSCKELKQWECPSQLKAIGYDITRILNVCHQHHASRTAYGYIWTFNGEQQFAKPKRYFLQIDKDDNVVKKWSWKDLKINDYRLSNICVACRYDRTAYGYKWKYSDLYLHKC
eukprot:459222_1